MVTETKELEEMAAPKLPDTTYRRPERGKQQLPECIAGWESYPIADNPTAITGARKKGVHIAVKGEGILLHEEDYEVDKKGRLLHRDCILGVRTTASRIAEDNDVEKDDTPGTVTSQLIT